MCDQKPASAQRKAGSMAEFKNKVVDMRGRLGANAILDELEQIFALGNRNLSDASTVLQRGLHTFGAEEMIGELCRRLTRLEPQDDSTSLVWALEKIGGQATIEQMQRISQAPDLAPHIRTDAAVYHRILDGRSRLHLYLIRGDKIIPYPGSLTTPR